MVVLSLSSCGSFGRVIFPIHSEQSVEDLDLPRGEYAVVREQLLINLAGRVVAVDLFLPDGREPGPVPWILWSMGVNGRTYFHAQFFTTLASYGTAVIAPQPRDISFFDLNHLGRIVEETTALLELLDRGPVGGVAFAERGSIAGFSVGGSVAAFVAAESEMIDTIVLWAPSPSPYWTGVDPTRLRQVTARTLIIIGDNDSLAAPDGWPLELADTLNGPVVTEVIPDGVHLYFMEPAAVDDQIPSTTQTRQEQYERAVRMSLAFLSEPDSFPSTVP